MKFGGNFSVPGDVNFESMPPWNTVMPQKPLPLKPYHILLNPQGNHLHEPILASDFQQEFRNVQLGDTYNCMSQAFSPVVQFPRNLATQDGMANHIARPYSQLLDGCSSRWNDGSFPQLVPEDNTAAVYAAFVNMNFSRNPCIAANAPTRNLHPAIASRSFSSSNLLLTNRNSNSGSYHSSVIISRPVVSDFPSRFDVSHGHSNVTNWLLSNENHRSSANLMSTIDRSPHISQDVSPIPVRPSIDLNFNLRPEKEVDATSCVSSQLQFTPYSAYIVENNQRSSILTCWNDTSSSKENEKHVDCFTSTGGVEILDPGAQLLQNIVESASAAISTPYKQNKDSDHESQRGIDLNETPPQKTPKRRKHRPKVVKEGKPNRTPKPAAEKNAEPKQPRTGKRMYMKKTIQKEHSSHVANITSEASYHNAGIGAKACKKVLDFDQDMSTFEKQGIAGGINKFDMKYSNLIDLESDMWVEKPRMENTSQHSASLNHLQSSYIILPEGQESAVLLPIRGYVPENNLHVSNRHSDCRCESTSMPQPSHAEGIAKYDIQAKSVSQANEKNEESANHCVFQSTVKSLSPAKEGRNSKRDRSHNIQQTHNCSNYFPSSVLCEKNSELCGTQEISSNVSKSSHKKQKFDTGYLFIHDMPLNVIPVEDDLGRSERERENDGNSNGYAAALNHTMLNSYNGCNKMKEREKTCDTLIEPLASNFPKQHMPSKSISCKDFTPVLSLSTNSITEACNQLVSTPPKKSSRRGKRQEWQTQEHKSPMKQTVRSTVLEYGSSSTQKKLQEENLVFDHQQSSTKSLGNSVIDEIIYRFSVLSIKGSFDASLDQERNALVPYKGHGAVVPYEGAEYIKKRKPRPKVDLDTETSRVWNLLMGKEGSAGTEGPDKQKQKYWEDERKVFQGRADSFIARMHLIQGDRRFSRWKGSVVDSVIGVFLTQNVSDHLSSSAFMSLAARFPRNSASKHQAQDKVEIDILVKESELFIPITDDSTKPSEDITSQPVHNPIFMAPYASAEHLRGSANSERSTTEAHSQCLYEEFVSYKGSFGPSVSQGTANNGSYSVLNKEAEDSTGRHQTNKVSCNSAYPLTEKNILFQEFYHEVQGIHQHTKWEQLITTSAEINDFTGTCSVKNPIYLESQKIGPCISPSNRNHFHMHRSSGEHATFGLGSFSEDIISSYLPSYAPNGNMEKADSYHSFRNIESSRKFSSSSVDNTMQRFQLPAIKDLYGDLRQQSTNQPNYSQPRSNEYYQPSGNSHQHEGNQTSQFQLEKKTFIDLVEHSEQLPEQKNGSLQHAPNVIQLNKKSSDARYSASTMNNGPVFPSEKEKYSHERAHNEKSTNISKGRKKKTASDKNNTVDWDNLRKKVFANGFKDDKSNEAMDSLDYEALMNANVEEVSATIRDRGMNKMLAERMQEFLKRVVKDHGSINLEWLRDVPPDQAKDYLLSIRGLGLKSVECVRLLTLHHLAFPVDTNVGRIAVRLGWVPLQTLPESLQLHLLEMYPMLESIQKYLWPRLCKLDQLTLYELHYQLITFGKVFCTKSKPNCNACPMRGECKHFASASASARLALPGLEEKSIVSSTNSAVAGKNNNVAGNMMSLPPPESYPTPKVGPNRSELIIEEPASPEQKPNDLHCDIEDLFNDDNSDDIPHLNLSIDQITNTLQEHMQNNGEGDLSKALVALNSVAASLPPPKLKNVDRLRTEHQVYELPDSHPLLEGVDRREPDDPCPYLLAIWTPGETAGSSQPPKISGCGSKDGNTLCSQKTCFSCNSIREEESQIVRGTILIPCRTAMKGSFPLNGTYFQVNEVFADHETSYKPIDVPRCWIWNLPRRPVYVGKSVTSIFRGLTTEGIQYCFWRGYVCVRGFDRSTRVPKPLSARLHLSPNPKIKDEEGSKRVKKTVV